MPDDSERRNTVPFASGFLSGHPASRGAQHENLRGADQYLVGDIAANAQRVIDVCLAQAALVTVDRVSGADAYRLSP